jgi:hypothetical protein
LANNNFYVIKNEIPANRWHGARIPNQQMRFAMAFVKVSDKLCGIYKIQHPDSGRIYIGQSIDCYHRLHRHISELKHQRHSNKALQNAYNKHGVDAFCFEQILACDAKNLSFYEDLLIGAYKSNIKPFGYNFRSVTRNL